MEDFNQPTKPTDPLNLWDMKWSEARGYVQKARARIVPGINGLTYKLLTNSASLFWKLFLAWWTTKFALRNGYINTSVQKAATQDSPSGCLEHTTMTCSAIQEAREQKGLCVVWLDLANVYGSVPHTLIQKATYFFHVLEVSRTQYWDTTTNATLSSPPRSTPQVGNFLKLKHWWDAHYPQYF